MIDKGRGEVTLIRNGVNSIKFIRKRTKEFAIQCIENKNAAIFTISYIEFLLLFIESYTMRNMKGSWDERHGWE